MCLLFYPRLRLSHQHSSSGEGLSGKATQGITNQSVQAGESASSRRHGRITRGLLISAVVLEIEKNRISDIGKQPSCRYYKVYFSLALIDKLQYVTVHYKIIEIYNADKKAYPRNYVLFV